MVNKIRKNNVKDMAIASALSLAAERPWQDISLADIIGHAQIDEGEAREYFDDKADVMAAYGRVIDRQMVENCALDGSAPHREQLFDLIMERFDIANENREAVISVVSSFKAEPKGALETLPHLSRAMARILEAAAIPTNGLMGCARVTAVMGIYLYALKIWMKDDSADLAKTMAALDKALDKAEMVYNSLPLDKFAGRFGV